MIPFYRFAEVGIYSLLSFLPFLLLALYPFRKMLRFSKRVTSLLILGVTVVQLGLGVWAAFFSGGRPGIISAVSTVIYAGFYFAAVKAPAGKTIFTLLMLTNTQNFAVVAAKCLEGQVLPAFAVQSYRWSFSLALLVVECVVLLPLFIYIKKVYAPAAQKEPSGPEWRYLWLIPATFYLLWYYGIYGNVSRTSLEIALRPGNTFFFFFINLGAFVVYHVIATLVLEQARNLELRDSNHRLAMQTLQYKIPAKQNCRGAAGEARCAPPCCANGGVS